MGRLAGRLALVSLALAAVGCKDSDRGGGSAAALAADEGELAEEEDGLLDQRDALLAARQSLRGKREELILRRAEITAQGGDTSEIDAETNRLLDEERQLFSQEEELGRQLAEILHKRRSQLAALSGTADETARVAAREAQLVARERAVAQREERLAQRERGLGEREERMADRWRQSCTDAVPTTIVQTVDARGSSYTKKDVEPLLAGARREMSRKGIRRSDLPDQARDLEKEATDAMARGDFGRARFAAQQLLGTVRGIRVDRNFISAKFGRLNLAMRGKTLTRQQEDLLKQATSNYGDGNFAVANRILNQLYGSLD
jgi:hypothetical protein